jgi:hypothetical protein
MKNLLISYIADVDNEQQAQAHLNALLYILPEHYRDKFLLIDVLEVEI